MKTKIIGRTLLLVVFLVLIASSALASHVSAAGTHDRHQTSPEAVIKQFYGWYINAVEAGTDPFTKGRKTLQKYVTARLISQIERSDIDADEFLQTQEWDAAWAITATVSNLRVKALSATAIVTFDSTSNYPRVSLTLLKEAGGWKIDRVRNAPLKGT